MTAGLRDLDPDQIAEVKRLFALASEVPEAQRAALLEGCNAEIRDVVSSLMRALSKGRDFLDGPALAGVADDDSLPAGCVVGGRYLIESPAGEGGFGRVYRARDLHLPDRAVAVKILFNGISAPLVYDREIAALTLIEDSRIVGIVDAGELPDGRLFVVTQWVDGQTLAEIGGSLTDPELERLVLDIAAALDGCARAGVVHLDLRPENIMRRHAGGNWVLVDFGVARLMAAGDESWHLKRSHWSAPELASGRIGIESDYYSLGVILSDLRGDRSIWRPLISSLLAPDPARRASSSGEVSRKLPSAFRNRLRLFLTAAAVVAFCLTLLSLLRLRPDPGTAVLPTRLTTYPGEETGPSLSPDGKHVYFSWNRTDGSSDVYALEIGRTVPRQLTFDGRKKGFLALSPDGSRLAFVRFEPSGITALAVLSLLDGREHIAARGILHSTAWTPDGRAIVVSQRDNPDEARRLVRIDSAGGGSITIAEPVDGGSFDWPAYSPDGKWLAWCRNRGHESQDLFIRAASPDGTLYGDEIRLTEDGRDLISPAWFPDSRNIAFLDGAPGARRLWAIAAREGAKRRLLLPGVQDLDRVTIAALSPRMILAQSRMSANIWRYSAANRSVQPVAESSTNDEQVEVSPDGRLLAFSTNRSGEEEVWVSDPQGNNDYPVFPGSSQISSVSPFWIGNEELLVQAYRQGARELWTVHIAGPPVLWRNAPEGQLVGVSRDRRYLYLRRSTGLWRVARQGGEEVHLSNRLATRAVENLAGTEVFFTLSHSSELWRMNIAHPFQEKRADVAVSRRGFDVVAGGIIAAQEEPDCVMRYVPFEAKTPELLWRASKRCWFGLSALPDGRAVYSSQLDSDGVDLVLLDEIHP